MECHSSASFHCLRDPHTAAVRCGVPPTQPQPTPPFTASRRGSPSQYRHGNHHHHHRHHQSPLRPLLASPCLVPPPASSRVGGDEEGGWACWAALGYSLCWRHTEYSVERALLRWLSLLPRWHACCGCIRIMQVRPLATTAIYVCHLSYTGHTLGTHWKLLLLPARLFSKAMYCTSLSVPGVANYFRQPLAVQSLALQIVSFLRPVRR